MNTMLAMVLAAVLGASPAPAASKPQEKAFDTAQAAADALVAACEKGDSAALTEIFGPSGKDVVASGDPVEDKNNREKFAALARDKMRVDVNKANPNRATVVVGKDDWPLPVPLVKAGGKWHFDTKAGAHEILMRRIGGNELDAIQVCRGYVEAQWEYAILDPDKTGSHVYAQKIISTEGKRDGLGWRNADGTPGGPIGDEIAKAMAEGYSKKGDPFHGYYFKILTAQGKAAPLGDFNYVIQGKMIGGFALVAWPSNYRNTGVMTFIVNHDGIVYEKDLGADTDKIARGMERYNPDKTWKRVPSNSN